MCTVMFPGGEMKRGGFRVKGCIGASVGQCQGRFPTVGKLLFETLGVASFDFVLDLTGHVSAVAIYP